MSSEKLKNDLNNCLINFDRRVLITGLLEDYRLSYKEVEEILNEHLNEHERKDDIKFEKRYLIHGQQESGTRNEIYAIVKEEKLKNWLDKLKNAEFSLYSVEVAEGAKSAAPVFKPMRIEECMKTKTRHGAKATEANGIVVKSASPKDKKEVGPDIRSTNMVKKESTVEIEAPIKDISPTNTKTDKKPAVKKGINNFFAPATSATKKPVGTKDSKTKEAVKKTTPKKMNDFFKKQAETSKPSTENVKNSAANISVQLFDEEEPEEESSSDEEEKLEALKRDIISSDVEIDEEDEKTVSTKRRRILDSDEEEDPPVKQEKLDIEEETKEEKAVAETYLDEDGFVITKKPKQKGSSNGNKQIATKNVPAVTMKPSSKETNKSSSSLNIDSKPATNPTAKTKQVGIMNFFSKK